MADDSVQRYGPLELRVARRQLLVHGRAVALGGRAWDLLLALVERRDRVVPKEELLAAVWRDEPVEEGNLQTQVSALRRLIGREAIATVARTGYRFVLAPAALLPQAEGAGPLVGRTAESAQLAACIDAGAVALVFGEAGIGKSRLVAECRRTHALGADAFVLTGARPADAAAAYASAGRLFRALAARLPKEPQGPWRAELARAVPEWGSPPRAAPEEALGRLARAAGALLAAACERGVGAVVFDDLHFADEASARLLAMLLDDERRRCAWVLAAREHELAAPAQALVAGQAALASTQLLRLAPLPVESAEQLLAALGHPADQRPARARALVRHTGGNPLFMLETLRLAGQQRRPPAAALPAAAAGSGTASPWPVPEPLLRLIQRRLAQLPPRVLPLLRCAAVAGDDLSLSLAAALLGREPLSTADDWAELEAAGVLCEGAFAHDLIAEAARALVPPSVAALLHRQVARWLEAAGGDPARVAAHALRSDEPLTAVPALLAAGRRARAASWMIEAQTRFATAAELLERAGQRAQAFDAWLAAVEARSEHALDAVYHDLCRRLELLVDGDDGRRAVVCLAQAAAAVEAGRLDDALPLAARTALLAQRAGLVDVELELRWTEMVLHHQRADIPAARHAGELALALLPRIDPGSARLDWRGTQLKVMHFLAKLQMLAGDYAGGIAQAAQTERLAIELRAPAVALTCANVLAIGRLETGDAQAALGGLLAALEQHLPLRESLKPMVFGTLAQVQLVCGQLGAAWTAVNEALAACRDARRHEARLQLQRLMLARRLGIAADVAPALQALRRPDDGLLPDARSAALIEATAVALGGDGDAQRALAEAVRTDDAATRAQLLCLLAGHGPSAELAVLLPVQARTARAQGAGGLALSLEVAEAQLLQRLGQAAAALDRAGDAWQRLLSGVSPVFEPFDVVAAALLAVVGDRDRALADDIALHARAWVHRAAATLPRPMRRPYLQCALGRLPLPRPGGQLQAVRGGA
jgi:hypothetical protein